MKLIERCSGQGFDSPQVHHKHTVKRGEGCRLLSRPRKCAYDGPVLEFDRAIIRKMDDPVGDDRKSSKTINANDAYFGDVRLAA